MQDEKAEWLIYVTDEGQAGHFKLVFGAGRRWGIIPEDNPPRIDHVGFGLVLGSDGKRIRTRDMGAVGATRLPLATNSGACMPAAMLHCTVMLACCPSGRSALACCVKMLSTYEESFRKRNTSPALRMDDLPTHGTRQKVQDTWLIHYAWAGAKKGDPLDESKERYDRTITAPRGMI